MVERPGSGIAWCRFPEEAVTSLFRELCRATTKTRKFYSVEKSSQSEKHMQRHPYLTTSIVTNMVVKIILVDN